MHQLPKSGRVPQFDKFSVFITCINFSGSDENPPWFSTRILIFLLAAYVDNFLKPSSAAVNQISSTKVPLVFTLIE